MTVSMNTSTQTTPLTHACGGANCAHCGGGKTHQSSRYQGTHFGNTVDVDYVEISSTPGTSTSADPPQQLKPLNPSLPKAVKDGFNPLTTVKNVIKTLVLGGMAVGATFMLLAGLAIKMAAKKGSALLTHVKTTPNKILLTNLGKGLLKYGGKALRLGERIMNSKLIWFLPLGLGKILKGLPFVAKLLPWVAKGKRGQAAFATIKNIAQKMGLFKKAAKVVL